MSQRTAPLTDDPTLARVIDFYETLTPGSLKRLGEVYCADAHFKDPFNEVQGLGAIEAIFAAMFETLESPRFVVVQAARDGQRAFLVWEFHFRSCRIAGGAEQCIHGASWLEFNAEARVARHRDYWDAAEELYEKLPAIGTLMRWLKSRLAH
jgi:steroid delta-isomerase